MSREFRPATGTPASPDFGERSGEKVDLHIGQFKDGRWSSHVHTGALMTGPWTTSGSSPSRASRAASRIASRSGTCAL